MKPFASSGLYSHLLRAVLPGVAFMLITETLQADSERSARGQQASTQGASGRDIFLREWIPGDSRSHGGDGLGPVFNDTSCVACHNQGGAGGGGPASKNVRSSLPSRTRRPDWLSLVSRH